MFSNYPPGVTGNEDQIAGPRGEAEETRTVLCEDCGLESSVVVSITEWRDYVEFESTCPECGYVTTNESYYADLRDDYEEDLYREPEDFDDVYGV